MARDTYEMTSPMHFSFLSYGFGVATYIPPAVAVLGFISFPLKAAVYVACSAVVFTGIVD